MSSSRVANFVRWSLCASAGLSVAGCSLDGLLLTELDRKGHRPMPEPAPVFVSGRAPSFQGATVRGVAEDALITSSKADQDPSGRFTLEFDGRSEVLNALFVATDGGRRVFGVVPRVPRQQSVLHPALSLDIAQLSPAMAALDPRTTTLALMVSAKARATGKSLSNIPASSMTDTLIELNDRLQAGDEALMKVYAMVERLTVWDKAAPALSAWVAQGSWLNESALGDVGFDYTGDGVSHTSTQAFDAALDAAVTSFDFKACYVQDKIRVVLQAKLVSGAKNGNCEVFDPFLWAKDVPGKSMFIAGGVHVDTPRCVGDRTTQCLTEAQIDALNEVLGNWQPNRVRMYDDGTNGDGVAGDGVWTFSFVAPWWAPDSAPDLAGVRVAYKFTWGNDGDGWTNTEEFPGHQRVLELLDRDGDKVVTRLDMFGDETTNKDKANQLAPSAGGCGELKWPAERRDGCVTDVHEREVDLDGDCVVDGWSSPGKATALTLPCP